jgi:D-alanine transaminase
MMYLLQDQLIPKQQVQISPDDRGYYFGDGVYEVFRVYDGKMFETELHMIRLEKSAAAVGIKLPYSASRIVTMLEQLISANDIGECTVYMQITRGAAPRSHPFPAQAEPVLMAYCTAAARPVQTMHTGISAITMDDIRWLRCDLKTLNLLPNVLAKQHALDRGAAEVIMHRSGIVTECSASNLFIVANGRLQTHPANNLILHGVTRAVVLRLAGQLHIEAVEEPFTLADLLGAEEAFLSGTTVEVTPVIRVDDQPICSGEPGPVTRRLQAAFEAAIK